MTILSLSIRDFCLLMRPFESNVTPFLSRYIMITMRPTATSTALVRLSNERNFITSPAGHSLGGALATLAAIDFKCNLKKPTIMYNYGSPRVGTHSFHHFFNGHVISIPSTPP